MIAIAMKLPMDLNNPMPGDVDQAAKLGSMIFMCTMMANLLPCLATMNNKELLTNVVALSILVITLVVNVCIQINTGVFSYADGQFFLQIAVRLNTEPTTYTKDSNFSATIFVPMLLMLLIITICSSLAILKSKQIIESKYQAGHETASKALELQQVERLTVEKLKKHVCNYWIMAGTGSPQFMIVCSATTSASGVICTMSTSLHIAIMFWVSGSIQGSGSISDYRSDYKWSMLVILIIQFIGVLLGSIAPLFRFFAALSFKLSLKWIWNHIKVFEVESYWNNMLYDWKKSSIPFSVGSRKWKIVIQMTKNLILSICIGFQKAIVVACKMIALVPIFFVICVWYCWKWLKAMFSVWGIMLVQNPSTNQSEKHKDLSCFVLQLTDVMEFAERTLKGLSESLSNLIQKAEKKQPKNLMKLLEESTGFEGVGKFDNHHVAPLPREEYVNCWSLPLVNLTTITISLPNIQKNKVAKLLSSVNEGLAYVVLVEETLNATLDYVNIQKTAKTLWLEVDVCHEWLGNKLQKLVRQENTARQILQWFNNTAKNMVIEMENRDPRSADVNSIYNSISANSMYRITESIMLSYHTNVEDVSQEKLFAELSSMISNIMAACLTNLPQVITMKCHTNAIEKREAKVYVAAELLGETTQIINTLQDRELPSLNPDDLAFIDKWCTHLQNPFP